MKPDLKNKKTAAVAGSLAGILIVAAILILLNAILKPVNLRWDCTEGKRYTLSRGTGNILKNLDKPVSIRFYYSRNAADMPAFLKTYASRVEDLLGEFQRAGGKRVELKKLNPTPDSDEEDSAVLDGISGQTLDALGAGEPVYLGVAVSSGVQVNVHDGPIPGVALREILPDFHSRYRESRVYAHAVIDGITYLYVLAHCVSFDYFA